MHRSGPPPSENRSAYPARSSLSADLPRQSPPAAAKRPATAHPARGRHPPGVLPAALPVRRGMDPPPASPVDRSPAASILHDRKIPRLHSSHTSISYADFSSEKG